MLMGLLDGQVGDLITSGDEPVPPSF